MTELTRALVVDDEEGIRFFLRETLQRAGHIVTTAASGEEALEILQETQFDLVMLDLMLGGRIDGQRVLEAIRWRWPTTIVIMLTAHGTLESAVDAVREGIDGYLLKPVKPAYVRQAIEEAVDRRKMLSQALPGEDRERVVQCGPFAADLQRRALTYEGEAISLTPSQFRLMVHLMQNAGRVIPPPELVEVVRHYEPEHLQEARQIIKWYIHHLRKKIEPDPAEPRYLMNVRGAGYIFEA